MEYRRKKGWKPSGPPKRKGRPPGSKNKPKVGPRPDAIADELAAPPQTSTPPARRQTNPDAAAFKRPRGRPPAALPTLEALAAQEAPHLAAVTGGVCKSCKRDYSDTDRCCTYCGTPVRLECAGCREPMREGQARCSQCGEPARSATPPPTAAATEATPPPPAQRWDADDMFIVSSAVEMMIMRLNPDAEDPLSDAQRKRINERAAVVANKHFIVGGKWKEEIALGMAIAGAIFPAAYIGLVEIPREKRRAERERIKGLEKAAAAAEAQRMAAVGLRSVASGPTVQP